MHYTYFLFWQILVVQVNLSTRLETGFVIIPVVSNFIAVCLTELLTLSCDSPHNFLKINSYFTFNYCTLILWSAYHATIYPHFCQSGFWPCLTKLCSLQQSFQDYFFSVKINLCLSFFVNSRECNAFFQRSKLYSLVIGWTLSFWRIIYSLSL